MKASEAPAVEWERTLLPARVANYNPRWLDQLASGAVGWGRISPHPAWLADDGPARPRRVIPTNAAPITFYLRETADWLSYALAKQSVDEQLLSQALSSDALRVRALLAQRGACFAPDIQRHLELARQETAHALWELATAGLAAADGFDQLRALMDPRRKATTAETRAKRPTRTTAGRWSLLNDQPSQHLEEAVSAARQTDAALESFARMLLARYGVLFRDLLARESNAPRWRDLLNIRRRLEARGEIRGGRFVSGFSGEQFALPEAVDSLRTSRTRESQEQIQVAAADPLNLAGILFPGDRVSAVPNRSLQYQNGRIVAEPGSDAASAERAESSVPSGDTLPIAVPLQSALNIAI